jgi:hypothetical protein
MRFDLIICAVWTQLLTRYSFIFFFPLLSYRFTAAFFDFLFILFYSSYCCSLTCRFLCLPNCTKCSINCGSRKRQSKSWPNFVRALFSREAILEITAKISEKIVNLRWYVWFLGLVREKCGVVLFPHLILYFYLLEEEWMENSESQSELVLISYIVQYLLDFCGRWPFFDRDDLLNKLNWNHCIDVKPTCKQQTR